MFNYQISLNKFKKNQFNFCNSALDLVESYLSNRTQCVQINDTKSDFIGVKSGVPQGSIFGPLLFLLMINDIKDLSLNSKMFMYADDITLIVSHAPPPCRETCADR